MKQYQIEKPLWKKSGRLLNRSQNSPRASTYKEAREQAISHNIKVQHKEVR